MKGYMKLSLAGDVSKTEFNGEWTDLRKRRRVFNKPRRYKFTLYLTNNNGEKAVTTVVCKDPLTRKELTNLIHTTAVAEWEENIDVGLVLAECFAVVRTHTP